MINFRQRDDVIPSALILCAIVILAATLAYMLLVPKPSVARLERGRERGRRQILREITDTRTRTKQAQAAVAPRLWQGDPNTVSSAVLALLTQQARHHALKLGAFRPERPQALGGVTELPFSVQVSGPYPKVQAVMTSLDGGKSRVVLRAVQVASSEETSDVVTATLGLSAYLALDPAILPPPAPAAAPAKKRGRHA